MATYGEKSQVVRDDQAVTWCMMGAATNQWVALKMDFELLLLRSAYETLFHSH